MRQIRFSIILRVAIITLALNFIDSGAWSANLLYQNGFESDFGDINFSPCKLYDWSFRLDRNIVRAGSQSARIENRGLMNNDVCSGSNDHKHRAQLVLGDKSISEKFRDLHQGRWLGFSAFFPTNHPVNNPGGFILFQLNGGCSGPEFDIIANPDGKTMRITSHASSNGSNKSSVSHGTYTIEKGKWTDFVIYRERSWENRGVTKVWINGKQVADHKGSNATNYLGCGSKEGVVRPVIGIYWADQVYDKTFVVHFDEARIAEGSDAGGFNVVSPNGKASAAPTPTPVPTPVIAKPKAPQGLTAMTVSN